MKRTTWIARTAICLALLVCLQFLTRSFSQLVTGSCVNLILAMTALTGGVWSGDRIVTLCGAIAFALIGAGMLVFVAVRVIREWKQTSRKQTEEQTEEHTDE